MRSARQSTTRGQRVLAAGLTLLAATIAVAAAFLALDLPAQAHPGHPQKKLFEDRWYQQVENGDYDAWMTLSTSDIWLECDGSPQACGNKWFGPFDASLADWNSQNTTVRFDHSKGVRDEEFDVNVAVWDTVFGDPFLYGLATLYDINYDECFTTCTTWYGWVDIGDDIHSGDWGSPQDRQATISHEVGHLLGLAHESVNDDESVHYGCGEDDTGPIPVSIMSYDCIDPVSAGGQGIYEVQPWDVCGVNHAYFDPTIGYATRVGAAGQDDVCGSGPAPTLTTTPTPGPTGTPGGLQGVQGDVDCEIDVDSVDALKDLRHVASLPVTQNEPCPNIGTLAGKQLWGDVDCDGDVDSVDALKILRHVAALSVAQNEPCTDIGQPFAALEGEGDLEAAVVDAVSGDPLPGVIVRLHAAVPSRVESSGICAGVVLDSATTNNQGRATFNDVPAGFYNVTIDGGDDYIGVCRENVLVLDGQTTSLNVGLSPNLAAGEIRIVLNWGATPVDLDSHLWLPQTTPYHVCYSEEGSSGSFPFAELDLDDTTSFGPETITIYEAQPGIYTYAVHNFSGEFEDDVPITQSGARVDVFGENGLIASFNVPTSGNGYWWEVFTLNAETGQVTPVNQIGGDPEPYPAGACP